MRKKTFELTRMRNKLIFFSYDGNVSETADPEQTTHILTTADCQDLLALHDACPKANVVNVEWLESCITEEKILNTNLYKL